MKKETIYIDIEDDITSIIDKVTNATETVVALVPPKRIGMLQSIVNLKLLQRAAKQAGKQLVLVTNDAALIGLASELSMPVAKNLQSKPEITSPTRSDIDDEEVIDGSTIPISRLAPTIAAAGSASMASKLSGSVDDIESEEVLGGDEAMKGTAAATAGERNLKKPASSGVRLPDFDIFRKKFFFIIGGLLLVSGFLVWAVMFAPHAKIAITARTNIVNIAQTLQLKNDGAVNAAQKTLPAVTKQIKKTVTADFQATGQKDVGEKATGSVKFTASSVDAIADGTTIPAGAIVTSASGKRYLTTEATKIDATPIRDVISQKYASATASVIAEASGASFNGATGKATGPSGVSTSFVSATTGGTDKTITIVSQADIDQAKSLIKTDDQTKIKDELKTQFGSDNIVIEESFSVIPASPVSTPAIGQEASAAKLAVETTYTLIGVARTDLKMVYDEYLKSQIGDDKTQRVFASGDKDTNFSDFQQNDGGYSVRVSANAEVGPNIDKAMIAEQSKGKREGEIQQSIESIQGIEKAEVTLSPFWVKTAPGDVKKIDVTFVLKND